MSKRFAAPFLFPSTALSLAFFAGLVAVLISRNDRALLRESDDGLVEPIKTNHQTATRHDAWKSFARENECSDDISALEYSQIYSDLAPWTRAGKIRSSEVSLRILCPGNDADSGSCYSKDGVEILYVGVFKNGSFSGSQDSFWKTFAHLLPSDKTIKYAVSRTDYPVSIPSDDRESLVQSYSSINNVLESSQCLRNQANHAHGFFHEPYRFHMLNLESPVFSRAKIISGNCFRDILIPGEYHFHEAAKWEHFADSIPWTKKAPVLFWRGSTTGCIYSSNTTESWLKSHRTRLLHWELNFAARHPGRVLDAGTQNAVDVLSRDVMVDVGIFAVSNTPEGMTFITPFVRKHTSAGLKSYFSFKQQLKFKYLLVVDGNTWPGRLQWYLGTNSVVLYAGMTSDYWMGVLEAWVHYIPVSLDFSDLEDRLVWLQQNDEEARHISLRAQKLVKGLNRVGHMQCYAALALIDLHAWRDHTARLQDESVRFVYPTHLLLSIAAEYPTELPALRACCHPVMPNLVKVFAADLLPIIDRTATEALAGVREREAAARKAVVEVGGAAALWALDIMPLQETAQRGAAATVKPLAAAPAVAPLAYKKLQTNIVVTCKAENG
ncbi:glycosyl transferase family 90-domain-containing protein [Chytriomyces sp. MP71]|nr:glycosyl transferase family 90-domain-containing protein [Chytriomyces sp. MP71]